VYTKAWKIYLLGSPFVVVENPSTVLILIGVGAGERGRVLYAFGTLFGISAK
jgi:hypothetical protein